MTRLITPSNGQIVLTTTATYDDASVGFGTVLDLENPSVVTVAGTTDDEGTIEVDFGAQLSLLGATTGNGRLLVSGPSRLSLLGGYIYTDSSPATHIVVSGDGGVVEFGNGSGFVTLARLQTNPTFATDAKVIIDSATSNISLLGFLGSDTIAFAHSAVSVAYTTTNKATGYGDGSGNLITQAGYLTVTESDGSVSTVSLDDSLVNNRNVEPLPFVVAPTYNQATFAIVNGEVVYVPYVPPVAPVIIGTGAYQATREGTNERPFSRVVVTDGNAGSFDYVVVQLATLTGTFLDPNAATDGSSYNATKGTYTIAGSASQVTQALNTLVFVPTFYTLRQGGSFMTFISLAVGSSAGPVTVDTNTSVITYSPLIANNFAGNGTSGVLVQNNNGGAAIDSTNGLTITATTSIANSGPSWHLVGSADFNGDGQTDLLYQNDSGAMVGFVMNGTSIASGVSFGNPGSNWHVRGTGGFFSGYDTDLLVEDESGDVVALQTNGHGLLKGALIGTPLAQGSAVEAVADFNGDGRPDLLVQTSTGELDVLILNGTTVASTFDLGNPGSGYTVLGAADYNADSVADVVLRAANGDSMVWTVSGGTVPGSISLGNLGAGPGTAVTGLDLNGDGHPDLVVQNSTTSTAVGFLLNGNASITAGAVLATPGAGWNIVGSNPISFIDGTGGNLNLVATPGPDQFNVTAFQDGVHTISGFNPSQDTLALAISAFPTDASVQANEVAYQGGTLINLTPTATIVIQGVTPSQLGSSSFVLR